MKSKIHLYFTALFAVVAFASNANAERTNHVVTETYNADSIENINLYTSGGNIQVIGEDREDISLKITYRIKDVRESRIQEFIDNLPRETRTEDSTLYLKFERKDKENDSWFSSFVSNGNHVQISLEARVPHRISPEIRTSGGNVTVKNIDSDLKAKTSGGNMNFENIGGSLQAKTSGGDIRAINVAANAQIKTSGGNLNLRNMQGSVDGGTSGGNIYAELVNGINQDTNLRTSGGNVKIILPSETAFYLNAHTSGGRVHSDFSITSDGDQRKNKRRGSINGGGPSLSLHSSGGNISVTKS